MRMTLNPSSVDDYKLFLAVKSLPKYRVTGRSVEFPDEYAATLGLIDRSGGNEIVFAPSSSLFDYQSGIAEMALKKKKFSVFADCGLGKTCIIGEFVRHIGGPTLIVSPLMVIGQTIAEFAKFFPSMKVRQIRAHDLAEWMLNPEGIAITNYEAITEDLPHANLRGIVLDESSMLKSHYGAWGTRLIELGRGVEYKLCCTGTPAPNDRIEYANHAVFMDAFPTVNSFLARFFVNRGQTNERWELKAHAIQPFYKALSHWCIFLTDPTTYGWKSIGKLPPINVHIHHVPSSSEQRAALIDECGTMFVTDAGGIGSRGKVARIGKGFANGKKIESAKTKFVADLVASWPNESTIVWCKYNAEQDDIAAAITGCGNISGDTPTAERERIVAEFKDGTLKTIVSKPRLLGFGLNLQICTRQVFASLQDSYEEYYQAVKRSNRYGSTKPLNVHIPITEFEAPMMETVLDKAHRIEQDTKEQEAYFREYSAK